MEATASPQASTWTSESALLIELAATEAATLRPYAFFCSWQGVLTLAFGGFSPPLVDLKRRLDQAFPLPPENSGSKWPKATLGCLRDGGALAPPQFDALRAVCREHSARLAALGGPGLAVDAAAAVLYECRSLERVVGAAQVALRRGGGAPPGASPEEAERVRLLVAEADGDPAYLEEKVNRPGNREAHYRGAAFGATLVHWLRPRGGGENGGDARAGDAARRGALLAAAARFRAAVDAALPGAYRWFDDGALHVTLRGLAG